MLITYSAGEWRRIADHAPDPWLAGTIDRLLVDEGSPEPTAPVRFDVSPGDAEDIRTIVDLFGLADAIQADRP